jgi:hypothetical protein
MSFKPLQFATRDETQADGTEPDPTAWPHSVSCRGGFIVILDFFLATLQASFIETKSCSSWRTTNTGQSETLTTRSVVLPSKKSGR